MNLQGYVKDHGIIHLNIFENFLAFYCLWLLGSLYRLQSKSVDWFLYDIGTSVMKGLNYKTQEEIYLHKKKQIYKNNFHKIPVDNGCSRKVARTKHVAIG